MAYDFIKQSIINNEFPADATLTETLLCNKYGFSRTPVREALHRLSSEGFVVFIKDKGAFVAQIGLEDLLQNYEIREALEGMAAKLCAVRSNKALVEELNGLLQKIKACHAKGNLSQAMAYDMEFHRRLIRGSKNTRLEAIMGVVLDLISCMAYKADEDIISLSIEDHERILDAIESSDAEQAEAIMREHIAHSKKYHFDKFYLLER
ncbi:MAG: GntR family transcriptional regulator [Planctomycetaceae bacterium]|nr:GntR family transcriptional regulator [Planctomycetaceae bacterium]